MKEYKIYYSVQNGGDGSAYPHFFESKELAQFDQETMEDCWGESCDGSLTILSDGNVIIPRVITTFGYLLRKTELDKDWYYKEKFIKEFLPNGTPDFNIIIEDNDKNYYHIEVNGEIVYKEFAHKDTNYKVTEEGRINLKKEILERIR